MKCSLKFTSQCQGQDARQERRAETSVFTRNASVQVSGASKESKWEVWPAQSPGGIPCDITLGHRHCSERERAPGYLQLPPRLSAARCVKAGVRKVGLTCSVFGAPGCLSRAPGKHIQISLIKAPSDSCTLHSGGHSCLTCTRSTREKMA